LNPTDYQAYLLRLRRLDNDGQPVWRISLESPGSGGEHWAFANLEALVTFLTEHMAGPARASSTSEDE
jgi:hypothetical protein